MILSPGYLMKIAIIDKEIPNILASRYQQDQNHVEELQGSIEEGYVQNHAFFKQ